MHVPAEDEQPVTGITVPIRLEYDLTAGVATTPLPEGSRPRGRSSAVARPSSDEVYAASRGTDPKSGEPTSIEVEVRDTGVITTFCVVNVPGLSELAPEIPYVSAQILLDGANNCFFGLIRGIPVEDVHMGQRVKAKWADELKADHTSIQWFEPTGEPDADYEIYKDYLVMRDVAVVSYVCSTTAREAVHNETEMIVPVLHEAVEKSGIPSKEIGFVCSGSLDYLQGGPFAFVSGLDAVGAWPPVRESHVEMDAAWALYEAWVAIQTGEVDSALDLRLRQVVARRPARDHGVAARPVLPAAAVAVDGRHGRAAGVRVPRRQRRDREGPRRGRGPFAAQRAEQSRTRCARAT